MAAGGPGISLGEIVARLGGKLVGDRNHIVTGVATLASAGADHITFLANPKYRAGLATTRAGAVILSGSAALEYGGAHIVVGDAYGYFARVAQLLTPAEPLVAGVHASAVVEAELPATCSIAAGCHVGAGVELGDRVRLGPGCVVGAGSRIGDDSTLHANVVLYSDCVIGKRAIIHSGVVIGSDGFGFAREADGSWLKIPQTGRAIIGDDVEIGANTTIDRGALDDTVIGDGVKLDNQVQIAHNVRIGGHSVIAGCVGIAGSTRIGSRCMIGGAAMIIGHVDIADDVVINGATFVGKSISRAGTYTGQVPAERHDEWLRNFAHLRHLDAMADRIRALERRLAELENKS